MGFIGKWLIGYPAVFVMALVAVGGAALAVAGVGFYYTVVGTTGGVITTVGPHSLITGFQSGQKAAGGAPVSPSPSPSHK